MKKVMLTLLLVSCLGMAASAQKYMTRTGTIGFYADSELKDAKAESHQVRSVLDGSNGQMAFVLLIRSFEFEKALMQTHFNSDLNSEEFPKSTFKGSITNFEEVDLSKNGEYQVQVSGDLTLHGETNTVEATGTLTVKGKTVTANSTFKISTDDYDIGMRPGVSHEVEITVDCAMNKMK